jgi:hypothetical protein
MVETEKTIRDEITNAGLEKAVASFFGGVIPTEVGKHRMGIKQIEVCKDKEYNSLSARGSVDGVNRAVFIRYYYSYGRESAYLSLQGEEDANGERDHAICNRWLDGSGGVEFFKGPGVNLSKKRLVQDPEERLEMAKRLGIELNVQPPHRILVGE